MARRAVSFAANPQFFSAPTGPSSSAGRSSTSRRPHLSSDTPEDEEEEDDSSMDTMDVICAIDHVQRKIGCAYFSMADRTLRLVEDIEVPDKEIVETCKFAPTEAMRTKSNAL